MLQRYASQTNRVNQLTNKYESEHLFVFSQKIGSCNVLEPAPLSPVQPNFILSSTRMSSHKYRTCISTSSVKLTIYRQNVF